MSVYFIFDYNRNRHIFLLKYFSYNAIPIAWSLGYWVTAVVGLLYLEWLGIRIRQGVKTIIKCSIAALSMMLCVGLLFFLRPIVPLLNTSVAIICAIIVSIGVYIIVLKSMHTEEVDFMWKYMKDLRQTEK